jgi:hypothetical protein
MLTLTCAYVREALSAYHDEELPIADRIAIADHLENCPACAVEANDLVVISEALHASGRSDEVAWMPGLGRLQSDIIERLDAEEKASLGRRFRQLFDDRRRASMSVAVSLSTSLCMAVCALLLAHGSTGDPNSLRAVMTGKARNVNIELPPEAPVELPRADAEAVMPVAVISQYPDSQYADGDSASAFSVLITSNGDLTDLEFLGEQWRGRKRPSATRAQRSALLNAVATARFQPARVDGSPVDLNVVWLVTHRTVRAPLHARVEVHIDGFRL